MAQCGTLYLEKVKDKQKEGVMVGQDYLFMALLMFGLFFFMHMGGTHHFRH
jgi:hypothetical protein